MGKEEIVKKFFEKGFLISPKVLEEVDEENLDEVLKSVEKKEIFIESIKKPKFSVKIREINIKNKLSPHDFIEYFNNKYEGIKKLLVKKINPVSINKVSNFNSNVDIIGIVKEVFPNGIILEDPTGEIEVNIKDTENIFVNDVVGVNGYMKNGKFFGNKIIFPDVPLTNEIKKIKNIKLILTTKINEKMNPNDLILIPELKENLIKENIISNFPNPGWIKISKEDKDFNVLVYKPKENLTKEEVLNFIKKRHLSPSLNQILNNEDYFLIDPIPDIIWLISNKKWIENYKGITIISNKDSVAVVNLETREVEFKDI